MRAALVPVLLLAAGFTTCGRRPDPPQVPDPPAVIKVPIATYVPIDKKYTRRCEWVRDGALVDVIEVARGRKKCLEFYETNLDTIEQVQSTPVPPQK